MGSIFMGETTGTIENHAGVQEIEQDIKQAVEKMVSEYWDYCNAEFIDAEVINLEPSPDNEGQLNWVTAVVVQVANGKRYGFGLAGYIAPDNEICVRNQARASTFSPETDGLRISQDLRNKLTKDTAAYWCDIWDLQKKRKPRTK